MAFDYKKEYKEFYLPKDKPSFVTVPPMNYLAVRGKGDPNAASGEYKDAIGLLYGIAFTIKMSKKGSHQIEGYFDYVVPPLEGFWWQQDRDGVDFSPVELLEYREGLTVQCMHVGPYDDEPATIQAMLAFAEAQGCAPDMTSGRYHHEIYLSDARRVAPEQRKTVLRIPLRRLGAK